MQRFLMTAAGATFIAVGTVSISPSQAALIDFSFITQEGGTGSLNLDTNTAPDPSPAIFIRNGSVATGIAYTNSISNLSYSGPEGNLSGIIGDFSVYPSITLPNSTIAAIVNGPGGCVVSPDIYCSVAIGLVYSGNVSELPQLSADPGSYFGAFQFELFDPSTGDQLSQDPIIEFQTSAVPEPSSILGFFTAAILGMILHWKKR